MFGAQTRKPNDKILWNRSIRGNINLPMTMSVDNHTYIFIYIQGLSVTTAMVIILLYVISNAMVLLKYFCLFIFVLGFMLSLVPIILSPVIIVDIHTALLGSVASLNWRQDEYRFRYSRPWAEPRNHGPCFLGYEYTYNYKYLNLGSVIPGLEQKLGPLGYWCRSVATSPPALSYDTKSCTFEEMTKDLPSVDTLSTNTNITKNYNTCAKGSVILGLAQKLGPMTWPIGIGLLLPLSRLLTSSDNLWQVGDDQRFSQPNKKKYDIEDICQHIKLYIWPPQSSTS